MKRIFVLLTVKCFCLQISLAQSGSITGLVKDSATGVVLESATVSVFGKDSALISYRLTDAYGAFQIGKMPIKTNIRLNVSYAGFKSFNKAVRLDSSALNITIFLVPSFNDSSQVVVTAQLPPVRMNGDTLEINPAAFKMGPNAVVEDLLTQVPGIIVWSDGTITMNGKKMSNVLVDGKPFLGSSDPVLATQNLPKNAIDKIQIYQEVERTLSPDDRRPKDSVPTMNIKLKKDKKAGYFGKAGAGYGTMQRFESDLSFQMYNKKTSLGIGGGFNNINKNVENLNDMFRNSTYRNYNPNLYNTGNFNTSGINKYHSIGGVFTHNFIESTNSRQNDRLTVSYTKSGNEKFFTNLLLQNRTTLANPQFVEDNTVSNSSNDNHKVAFNYIKTNSYSDNLSANGNADVSSNNSTTQRTVDIKDSLNNPISKNNVQSAERRKSNSQGIFFNYGQGDNQNPLTQFSADLNLNNSRNTSDRFSKSVFRSFINSNEDTTFNRNYNNNETAFNTVANISYGGLKRLIFGRYNLFGIDLSLKQRLNYVRAKNDQKVFDYDSISGKYTINSQLTNNNLNEKTEYTPSLVLGKSFFKYRETFYRNFYPSLTILNELKKDDNASSFAIRNLSRSFSFFRYEAGVVYAYNKRENFNFFTSAGYRKTFEYATIDQLYTITDGAEVFNVRIGNPGLKNKISHNYNLNANFNTQNPKSRYAFNGNIFGSYVKSFNPVADSVINDRSGKRFYYYINAPASNALNFNYSANITRRLGKSNVQLMYRGSYNNNSLPTYIDNIYSQTKTTGINNTIDLQFTLRSAVIVKLGKTFNNYKTDQSGAGLTSFKNFTDISRFGLTVNLPVNYTFSTTIDYTKNSNLKDPIVLWNAFATCRFLKSQQGELKFSAMDILKQFKNISNTADAYGTSTRITNGLQQFFLLTFAYYPRKFGKTEIKKKATSASEY